MRQAAPAAPAAPRLPGRGATAGAGCAARAGPTWAPAANSRSTRGHEPAQIAVAGIRLGEQVPVPRLRGPRSRGIAFEAPQARGADPGPRAARRVRALPGVAVCIAMGHPATVMEQPASAGSFQRKRDTVRRPDPPSTAVPRRLRRARRRGGAGRRPKRRPGNGVGPDKVPRGLNEPGVLPNRPQLGPNPVHTYLHTYIHTYIHCRRGRAKQKEARELLGF